jgi:hypothetical protein
MVDELFVINAVGELQPAQFSESWGVFIFNISENISLKNKTPFYASTHKEAFEFYKDWMKEISDPDLYNVVIRKFKTVIT